MLGDSSYPSTTPSAVNVRSSLLKNVITTGSNVDNENILNYSEMNRDLSYPSTTESAVNIRLSLLKNAITTGNRVDNENTDYSLLIAVPVMIILVLFLVLLITLIFLRTRKAGTSWYRNCNSTRQEDRQEKGRTVTGSTLITTTTVLSTDPPSCLNEHKRMSVSCSAMTVRQLSKEHTISSPTEHGPLHVCMDMRSALIGDARHCTSGSENSIPFSRTRIGTSEVKLHRSLDNLIDTNQRVFHGSLDGIDRKVDNGSSKQTFHHSLNCLERVDLNQNNKFASYVTFSDNTTAIYKVPSSVPKFDPPHFQPPAIPGYNSQETGYVDMNFNNKSPYPYPASNSGSPKAAEDSPKPVPGSGETTPTPARRSPKPVPRSLKTVGKSSKPAPRPPTLPDM